LTAGEAIAGKYANLETAAKGEGAAGACWPEGMTTKIQAAI
jgi:hypothetical protein